MSASRLPRRAMAELLAGAALVGMAGKFVSRAEVDPALVEFGRMARGGLPPFDRATSMAGRFGVGLSMPGISVGSRRPAGTPAPVMERTA